METDWCPEHPTSPLTHLGCVLCEGLLLADRDRQRHYKPVYGKHMRGKGPEASAWDPEPLESGGVPIFPVPQRTYGGFNEAFRASVLPFG